MKLFQQLLVAHAALGLLATGANAAELNINGVSDYAASADQVTSVTQFSDVYATDWMVGLTWAEVANTPHPFNFGFGVPQYQTDGGTDAPDLSWEASLRVKVANNITIVTEII